MFLSALRTAALLWRDLPTHRRVWALAVPMVLSNLTIPLVALVDTAIAGHFADAHRMGAVAVGGSLYALMIGCFGFLRMGTTGFTAQATGRGDGDALRIVLAQGLGLALILAALLALCALPLTNLALRLAQAPQELHQLAGNFFHIRLFGLPAALANYALVGWFIGAQNTRIPFAMLVITNLCNIGLSLAFTQLLNWDIEGIARAAVCAEWTGVLTGLALCRLPLRRWPGRLHLALLRHWSNWKRLLGVNRDIFIRTLALQMVFLLITLRGAYLGEEVVAANAILLNGLLVTAFALDGFAHAVEAMTGHAIGAHDRQALRKALLIAGGWSLLLSLLFALFFLLNGQRFIGWQTDIPGVQTLALHYLPYLAALPLAAVWSYLLDGLFIGATRAREMRNAMLLALILALPLAVLLQSLGNQGLWIAFYAFMVLRASILGCYALFLNRNDAWLS